MISENWTSTVVSFIFSGPPVQFHIYKAISKHETPPAAKEAGGSFVNATTPTSSYNIFLKILVQEILTAYLVFRCFPRVSLRCENTVGRE